MSFLEYYNTFGKYTMYKREKQDLVLSVKLQLKYNGFKSEKNLVQKNLGPKKIGSVKGEILLIWTNVARTYVALTNVTITVSIC